MNPPHIGRANAAVVLNGDVRIEHPFLKAPLAVPMGEVAAVVRVTHRPSGRESGQGVLRRDARVLHLPSSALTESNVVIVFKAPVRVARFRFGAENGLLISARERKRGLDLDAVGVTVVEPDQLASVLARRGVRMIPTVAQALSEVIGEATGDDAVSRRDEYRRKRSRARFRLVGFGVLWTCLLAARFALGGDGDDTPAATVIGVVLSSLAWAGLVALAVTAFAPGAGRHRPIRDRASGWHALAFLAAMVAVIAVPFVVAGWMASHLGTPRVLAYGLVAGVPGGVLCGLGLRATRTVEGS